MLVSFTTHAAERLEQRLNIRVCTRTRFALDDSFFLAKTYKHHTTGANIQIWAYKDPTQNICLVVDAKLHAVVTVYSTYSKFIARCYE